MGIAQNLACYLPGISTLRQARATTGAMNDPAVMAEWAGYIERDVTAAGKAVCGATFLEIGPGHSIGVALELLKAGAKQVYMLDVKEYADLTSIDPKLRERLHVLLSMMRATGRLNLVRSTSFILISLASTCDIQAMS